jgi:ribosomal protein S18 acetylase RimI-like enzyme
MKFLDKEISLVEKADLSSLNVLVNSAYRGEGSKKGWTTEADLLGGIRTSEETLLEMLNKHNAYFLKYTQDQEIIACVYLENQKTHLYLGMLTVKPDLQGAGVGAKLLAAASDFAVHNHIPKIRMTVISVRTELIAYYQRKGYVLTGETQAFPSEDPRFGLPKQDLEFVVMEKVL